MILICSNSNSNLLPAGTRMTCGRSCLPGRMLGFWLIIWTLCLKAHSCFMSWLSSKTAAMGMVPCSHTCVEIDMEWAQRQNLVLF